MGSAWLIINNFVENKKFFNLYKTLEEAFLSRGYKLDIKTASDIGIDVDLKIENKPDFVIFWDKDIYLAQRLESIGCRLFNSAHAIELCDNKILMYQELAKHNIRIPKTYIAPKTFEGLGYTNRDFVRRVIDEVGFPVVIKEAYGSFGEQVYLAHNEEEINNIIDRIGYKDFLLQEYISSSDGRDIRVNVVGNKVVVHPQWACCP